MTPQELKNSILQLAVQGKLVSQDPSEGTGEELYRQIQAEKQKLIKEGKIKKGKPLPEITEDEIPFDIPESWKWVRLGSAVYNWGQKQPENRFCYVDVGSINNQKHTLNNNNTVVEAKDASSRARKIVKREDVIFATIRPYLQNICIIDRDFPYEPIVSTAFAVMHCPNGLYNKFLYYYLLSPSFMSFANATDKAKGVAYPAIGEKDFFNGILPLPPLAEQKRIVAKIEELLPLIDRYEQAWTKLEAFNKRFPDDMQKSVLQMAIQGKLVEQRPEEGTGEELYKQIQTEKQKLIAEGKIKKEKPLPEITEDEIPFDIPESWKWVRLKDIVSVLGDGIHGTPIYDESGKYYFINGNNLIKGRIILKDDTKKVSESEFQKHKKPLDNNTILVSINGTIGNYAFYDREPVILGKSACYLSVMNGIYKKLICYLINTDFFLKYATNEATQTTIKNVSLKAMRMFPVPLPPLAEQKRIVKKLDEILPICEKLK